MDHFDSEGHIIPGGWRDDVENVCFTRMSPVGGGNQHSDAKDVRTKLMHYFNNEGQVPWQTTHVSYTGRRSDSDVE